MIFRTESQKRDLKSSFSRADRPFFAAGACHVLAQAFLDQQMSGNWNAFLIEPAEGYRGMHVYVSDGRCAFDYHGFTKLDRFKKHYFKKMTRRFPGWSADIIKLDSSSVSPAFCARYNHRRLDQFYKDPMPRALAFVQKFKIPS